MTFVIKSCECVHLRDGYERSIMKSWSILCYMNTINGGYYDCTCRKFGKKIWGINGN
ncbi:protein of unknown function [Petrocella atlantisensis]|uniref:Uncharacterized protein n=1 Tax=Petrocella atlantisensis TaxID=2173034 RepID=A0A3P7S2G3_9FIRM|nr:protein of unknown function [Petrocella atlantisensis]